MMHINFNWSNYCHSTLTTPHSNSHGSSSSEDFQPLDTDEAKKPNLQQARHASMPLDGSSSKSLNHEKVLTHRLTV